MENMREPRVPIARYIRLEAREDVVFLAVATLASTSLHQPQTAPNSPQQIPASTQKAPSTVDLSFSSDTFTFTLLE